MNGNVSVENTNRRSRKVRAILVGGLVLGVGAAVTLASWNDSEFAQGLFSSGQFNMQGSTDGDNFSDHAVGAPAQLGFSAGFNNLSPNDTVAAPFVLHLNADSTNDATVSVNSANATGAAATELSYGIVQVPSIAACTSTAVGTQIVPAGTALNAVTGADTFDLAKSADAGITPGADAFLCIQVTASADIEQNTSATGTWEFRGISKP